MTDIKVLFVASECAPFVKTGGLADVIGALPKALKKLGASVKIILPAYPALSKLVKSGKPVFKFDDHFGGPAVLYATKAEGLDLLLLDAPHLFDRPGSIYLDENGADWHDNHLRFGALCVTAAKVATEGIQRWKPQIVHAHDWQAGLTPLLIKMAEVKNPPKCVTTIHNIAFQGLFHWTIKDTFSIPDKYFTAEGAEYWGNLGFLKSGLVFADKITTVSPTYAHELLTPEFGLGLEGVLQSRSDDFSGIVNGIDLKSWNPATDPNLPENYNSRSLGKKKENRKALLKRFGLNQNSNGPLFCVISRLTEQKGLDLLLAALPDLVSRGGQLALLGSGPKEFEDSFSEAARRFPGQVGVVIGYDEGLSHLMQGGSDAILVPSRFEPCGLTQLYGLRYGTIPVVAKTGGLADTVIDATDETHAAKTATGFQFEPVTVDALRHAIHRTCDLFEQPKIWNSLVRNAMRYPAGWDQSAPEYMALYETLLSQ
jgi:starch synthase